MPLLPVHYVFVYGTLRRGEPRDINRLLPAPRWIGAASVPGVMYHLGAYPGVVLGDDSGDAGRVQGEVYEISAELERQLDEIEEVWPQQSGEYARRRVVARLDQLAPQGTGHPNGTPAEMICLIYEITLGRVKGKPVIASGNWLQRAR
jgi:gamma-glutamylcyclotransferase (GGCT)/AIG2-like uncharacterized protein YtfP